MYNDKVIYRANRIVTWSCALQTAIATIEVDYEEITEPVMLSVPGYTQKVEFGVMHSFAYKFADSNDEIVIATTRCTCFHKTHHTLHAQIINICVAHLL